MPAARDGSKNEPREERLLGEFLAQFHPTDRIITRVRLGSPPIGPTPVPLEPQEVKLLKAFSRWADALVIREAEVILIEAEILPSPGIISTLELYARLFRADPEYASLRSHTLRLMLLWAFRDPVLEQIAREAGIEVRIFDPPWVGEALAARFSSTARRKTRPVRSV